jgi:hypothetical protein
MLFTRVIAIICFIPISLSGQVDSSFRQKKFGVDLLLGISPRIITSNETKLHPMYGINLNYSALHFSKHFYLDVELNNTLSSETEWEHTPLYSFKKSYSFSTANVGLSIKGVYSFKQSKSLHLFTNSGFYLSYTYYYKTSHQSYNSFEQTPINTINDSGFTNMFNGTSPNISPFLRIGLLKSLRRFDYQISYNFVFFPNQNSNFSGKRDNYYQCLSFGLKF